MKAIESGEKFACHKMGVTRSRTCGISAPPQFHPLKCMFCPDYWLCKDFMYTANQIATLTIVKTLKTSPSYENN